MNTLLANDVVIPCGTSNDNLVAVLFRDVSLVAAARKQSSILAGTFATDTPGGVAFWLRIQGWVPPSCDAEDVAWFAGCQPVLLRRRPPAAVGWEVLNNAPILTLKARDLDLAFHPSLCEHLLKSESAHRHGSPFRSADRAPGSLNPAFWAAYAASFIGIEFDTATRRFRWYFANDKLWKPMPDELLTRKLADFIFTRTSDPAPHYRISLDELKSIKDHLRIYAAVEPQGADVALQSFVADRVQKKSRAGISSEDLFIAFEQYRAAHQLTPITQQNFYLNIGFYLENSFGAAPSHSIRREGKLARGYRSIALKPSKVEPGGTDATDGTGGAEEIELAPIESTLTKR